MATEQTKLEVWQEMQPFVQKEIQSQFETLYKEFATKYGVASVPLHRHNGADSPVIGNASISNFDALPATPGGVANLDTLALQVLDGNYVDASGNQNKNPPTSYVMPISFISGFGNPGDPNAAFHGGNAPIGTMIAFTNSAELAMQLFVRLDVDGYTNQWWGVSLPLSETP